MRLTKIYHLPSVLAITVFLGTGSATSLDAGTQSMMDCWLAGNYECAARAIPSTADKARDAIVVRLERGATDRAASHYADSLNALGAAEKGIDFYDEQAKEKVGEDIQNALMNPTTLPYKGCAYDKVMLNTYKAVNYLQLGDFEKARVELNRALERQKDAVAINAARIEAVQKAAKDKQDQMESVQQDEKFSSEWKNYYRDLDEMKFYANYVNPFAVYLRGLFFMGQPAGGSDLQEARKSFEDVLGMIGENSFITADLKTIELAAAGQPIPPTTYVLFETGCAPSRRQVTIDVPMSIFVRGIPYTGLAFPQLEFHHNFITGLQVGHDGTNDATLLLCSMDSVVAQEFKNDMPTVRTRTIAAAAVKAGALFGIGQGVGGNPFAKSLAQAAWVVWMKANNVADLRTWKTLPKEIQFCRIPTPLDRKIALAFTGSDQALPVTIGDGTINVVLAKSTSQSCPIQVSQFKLK
jgi:hypothetical protein